MRCTKSYTKIGRMCVYSPDIYKDRKSSSVICSSFGFSAELQKSCLDGYYVILIFVYCFGMVFNTKKDSEWMSVIAKTAGCLFTYFVVFNKQRWLLLNYLFRSGLPIINMAVSSTKLLHGKLLIFWVSLNAVDKCCLGVYLLVIVRCR